MINKNRLATILFPIVLLAVALLLTFLPTPNQAEAYDWTGIVYAKYMPYSPSASTYYSPINMSAHMQYTNNISYYDIINSSISQGASATTDGTIFQGSNNSTFSYDYIFYRFEISSTSHVFFRQVRFGGQKSSTYTAHYTGTDYGINTSQTSFAYEETVGRTDVFGDTYLINEMVDIVLVYEYYINGNSVRVSSGSVADEMSGGLSRATTVNPSNYQREGYTLDGFWSGENKTGKQVLDANGYFVDYAFTPGATLYPGYTEITYMFDVNNHLDGVDNGAESEISFSMSIDGVEVGTELDDYWDGIRPNAIIEIYDIETRSFYSEYTYTISDPSVEMEDSTSDHIKIRMPTKQVTLTIYFTSFGPDNRNAYWTDQSIWSGAGQDFNDYSWAGSGSEADPYLIQSEWDLAYLSWSVYNKNENSVLADNDIYFYENVFFRQTKDLDFSAYYWQPIGLQTKRDGSSDPVAFSGHYDGDGFEISGIYTSPGSNAANDYQALFGVVMGETADKKASISNIKMVDSIVQGRDYVAGIVGIGGYLSLENCSSSAIVWASYYSAGIVGYTMQQASISNCVNEGKIISTQRNYIAYVGGIVGRAQNNLSLQNSCNYGQIIGYSDYAGGIAGSVEDNATVQSCFNFGVVEANNGVGGIVGDINSDYVITINACFNNANICGNDNVGGIVGRFNGIASETISNCGVEGAVITGNSNVGIFVGYISTGATVENCYAVVEGGIAPYGTNSGTFTNCLWIEGDAKNYYGSDFSGFAWLNPSGCPIPKDLALAGQFWTEDITNQIISSGDWSAFVA